MPSKPNFNFERAERDRLKKASKEAKLRERKEQVALRKSGAAAQAEPVADKLPDSE